MLPLLPIALIAALLLPFTSSTPHAALNSRSPTSPVIPTNFQDPSILSHASTFYAFSAPNNNPPGSPHILLATSPDFLTWTTQPTLSPLPNAGPWTAPAPHVWAPDLNLLPTGEFILYYSAAVASSPSQHCVGAALSANINGPFVPLSTPIACELAAGGAIDPDLFIDPLSGFLYLIYKVDGNSIATSGGSCGNGDGATPTPILLQQVSNDGYTPLGPPIQIMTNTPDDGAGIEAPSLFYDVQSSLYVLMFNAGCYVKSGYRVEYAVSGDVVGPYTRMGVLVATGDTEGDIQLPGGMDVLGTEDGSGVIRAVMHGDLNMGWFDGVGLRVRGMYAVELDVGSGVVSLGGLL
jgi:beta-xylosidase